MKIFDGTECLTTFMVSLRELQISPDLRSGTPNNYRQAALRAWSMLESALDAAGVVGTATADRLSQAKDAGLIPTFPSFEVALRNAIAHNKPVRDRGVFRPVTEPDAIRVTAAAFNLIVWLQASKGFALETAEPRPVPKALEASQAPGRDCSTWQHGRIVDCPLCMGRDLCYSCGGTVRCDKCSEGPCFHCNRTGKCTECHEGKITLLRCGIDSCAEAQHFNVIHDQEQPYLELEELPSCDRCRVHVCASHLRWVGHDPSCPQCEGPTRWPHERRTA